MNMLNWILENYQQVITGAVALLSGALAISLIIPGDQPDRILQWIVDLLKKLSKK